MTPEFEFYTQFRAAEMKNVPKRLTLLIKLSGRSADQVARECGISRRSIFYYLDKRVPDPLTAAIIVTSLGFPFKALTDPAFISGDNLFIWFDEDSVIVCRNLNDPDRQPQATALPDGQPPETPFDLPVFTAESLDGLKSLSENLSDLYEKINATNESLEVGFEKLIG